MAARRPAKRGSKRSTQEAYQRQRQLEEKGYVPAREGELRDAILGYVVAGNGAESVSYIHANLRRDGWKGLGVLADFEATCAALGFTVRRGLNDRNQPRVEVAV